MTRLGSSPSAIRGSGDGLVSVIVPFHDAERFLEDAIRSVLAQSYRPLELILVDDGSSDGGVAMAGAMAGAHPEVRLLRLPRNQGPSAARNRGIEAARGDFLTFLDADDLMALDRLASQVRYLAEHPGVDVVLVGEEPVVEADAPRDLMRRRRSRGPGLHFHLMSMMVRRPAMERVGGFDAAYRVAEDLDWLFRASTAGLVIGRIERPLTRHRLHADNLSFRTRDIQRAMIRSLRARLREREAEEGAPLPAGRGRTDVDRTNAGRADADPVRAMTCVRVSVIIPFHDYAGTLEAAIRSVLGQTSADVELVLVDDGSTDGSAAVARRFVPPARYLRRENGGAGAARNTGIDHATGDFLAFCDADDLWDERKLERQLEAFRRDPAVDVVFAAVREFWAADGPVEGLRPAREGAPGALPSAMLIRRSAFDRVGRFAEDWRVGEWAEWYTRMRAAGLTEAWLTEALVARRLHARNNGHLQGEARTEYARILRAHLRRRRNAGGP